MDNQNYVNLNPNTASQNQQSVSYRDIVDFVWRLRWWIVGAVALCLVLAFFWVRMQTPQYRQATWIMLNHPEGTSNEMDMLAELSGQNVTKKIDNEAFILKSPSMMTKVVDELGLNTRYFHYTMPVADRLNIGRRLFNVKTVEYYQDNPFLMALDIDELMPEEKHPSSVRIEFKHHADSAFAVEKAFVNGFRFEPIKKTYQYGEPIGLEGCVATISLEYGKGMRNGDTYVCQWTTPRRTADDFVRGLTAEIQGQKMNKSDIIVLSLVDSKAKRARDILNTLVVKVNDEARDYGNLAAKKTAEFIDQRLTDIERELGNAESNYQQYQSNNAVLDLGSQSQLTISSDKQYQDQLNEVRLQLQVLQMLDNYINENEGADYSVIPANIGISDVGLNSIIANYNNMVTERNRMVANSSESNPRVQSMDTQLDDMKKSIVISVANLKNVYSIRERELGKIITAGHSKMATFPQHQFNLQKLGRRVDIIEPLYLALQQKREEAQIKMHSQTDAFHVLEMAFGPQTPISPQTAKVCLLALLLGLIIPPAIVWLRMQLRSKVETRKDLTDKIVSPVIAVLPKAKKDAERLISRNGRDATSESFRMLRSNLQYLPEVKVIQVTSSTPGEGKSYIASNLALSFAHMGKKTLVIGMDVRKPMLAHYFGISKVNTARSLVGYLIGKCKDTDDMITTYPDCDGLDIIQTGPVPPNPSELLGKNEVGDLLQYFRDKYEYIIIDSAPYLPVVDAAVINPYVDATLYVVRAGYTDLKVIPEINEVLSNEAKPLQKPYLILNDLNLQAMKYRYGYGYGYGNMSTYCYDYGYGYDNEEDGKSHRNRRGVLNDFDTIDAED